MMVANFFAEVWPIIALVFNWAYVITAVFVVLLIILENRSPVKAIPWVIVIISIPIVGIIFYIFFGQDYRKEKMFSRKGLRSIERLKILSGKQLRQLPHISRSNLGFAITEKGDIIKLLLRNSNAVITEGNALAVLNNGQVTFDSIFEALSNAKHHIHLQFYIIQDDNIGRKLANKLIEKAQAGVEVRVLYDDVGSWDLSSKFQRELINAGVQIKSFFRVRFPLLSSRVNYRNHRKIIVIDGKIGFTGGLNVADRYIEGIRELGIWRDTFIRIEGPAVFGLQSLFAADWYFTSKVILDNNSYYPKDFVAGGKLVQIISSGPDSDWPAIAQFYFAAISGAKKKVFISNPYFMPTDEIVSAVKTAALRGIDVRILIPKKSDSIIPHYSTESYFEEMLETGVKIYLYTKGFNHSKIIMVDDYLCSIGSANLDFRSLETNFEVNAVMYDRETTLELTRSFHDDCKNSERLMLAEWHHRPLWHKLLASILRLLSPLM